MHLLLDIASCPTTLFSSPHPLHQISLPLLACFFFYFFISSKYVVFLLFKKPTHIGVDSTLKVNSVNPLPCCNKAGSFQASESAVSEARVVVRSQTSKVCWPKPQTTLCQTEEVPTSLLKMTLTLVYKTIRTRVQRLFSICIPFRPVRGQA